MNPQKKYWEINHEVVNEVWNRLDTFCVRTLMRDPDHKSKVFAEFDKYVFEETEARFGAWQLNQVEPVDQISYLFP